MIRKGFFYPIPTFEEETWFSQKEEPHVSLEEVLNLDIDVDEEMI